MPQTTTVPVSVSQTDAEYAATKAAYFAAFYDLDGEADTMPSWVGQALQAHAARTTAERRSLHVPFDRSSGNRVKPRPFNLPADAVAAMRAAAVTDRSTHEGDPFAISESAWARDAIAAAVADVATALAAQGRNLQPMNAPLPRGRLRR